MATNGGTSWISHALPMAMTAVLSGFISFVVSVNKDNLTRLEHGEYKDNVRQFELATNERLKQVEAHNVRQDDKFVTVREFQAWEHQHEESEKARDNRVEDLSSRLLRLTDRVFLLTGKRDDHEH